MKIGCFYYISGKSPITCAKKSKKIERRHPFAASLLRVSNLLANPRQRVLLQSADLRL